MRGLIEDVSFAVRPGEILALTGAVGSRKTEIIEAIMGIRGTDAGTVTLDGKEIRLTGPRSAKRHGICLIPEDRRRNGIVPDFTVRENTTIAFLRRFTGRLGLIRQKREAGVRRGVLRQASGKNARGPRSPSKRSPAETSKR